MDKWQVQIVLWLLSTTWAGWALSMAIGRWRQKREDETGNGAGLGFRMTQLEGHLRALHEETSRRFDEAGKETSKAWTYVQGIEGRLIREFASRELVDTRFEAHRRDIDSLRRDVDHLRNQNHGG